MASSSGKGFFPHAQNFSIHGGQFVDHGNRTTVNNYFGSAQTDAQRIRRWLSPMKYKVHQREAFSKRAEGTGDWFLVTPEFVGWESNLSGDMMWCRGKLGAGKTTLASRVIDHLMQKHKDDPVLFAYLINALKPSLRDVWATLIDQLRERHPDHILPILMEAYARNEDDDAPPTELELFELLKDTLKTFEWAYIVIDAIDELVASEPEKTRFIKRLRSLRANTILTSRPLEHLEDAVPDIIRLDVFANAQDMRQYFEEKIDEDPTLSSLLTGPEKEDVFSKLVEMSDGIFLQFHLWLAAISDKINILAIHRTLSGPLPEIDNMYMKTWQRLCPQIEGGGQSATMAQQIILWLTYALQPLTLPMLSHAIAMDSESGKLDPIKVPDKCVSKRVVAACCGLITVEPETKVVRLIHDSAAEFLKKRFESRDGRASPHEPIARACVGYLRHAGFSELTFVNNHDLSSHSTFSPKEKAIGCWAHLQEFLDRPEYPLLRYAFQHWASHAREWSDKLPMPPPVVRDFLNVMIQYPLGVHIPDAKANPCAPCDLGSPLRVAARYGFCIEDLFCKFPADEGTSHSKQHPLHLSCRHGHAPFARRLLSIDDFHLGPCVDPNAQDFRRRTPLYHAATKGHVDIIRMLLSLEGIQPNLGNQHGITPLHQSAAWGHVDCLQLLLDDARVQVNPDDRGITPLMKAAMWGREECIEPLVGNEKVDIYVRDHQGNSAFMTAVHYRRVAIVRMFLELPNPPVDVNAQNSNGQTALMLLAYRRKGSQESDNEHRSAIAIAELILDKRPDVLPNLRDVEGIAALMMAAEHDNFEILERLLQHPKIKVNHRDPGRMNALMHAAAKGSHRCVAALLQVKTIKFNAADCEHETALHKAARRGSIKCVEHLLRVKGIDPSRRSKENRTPLQVACLPQSGEGHGGGVGDRQKIIQALLKRSRSKATKHALSVEKNPEIIKLLDNHLRSPDIPRRARRQSSKPVKHSGADSLAWRRRDSPGPPRRGDVDDSTDDL